MTSPLRILPGVWIALGTLAIFGLAYLLKGNSLFSPGRLHEETRGGQTLGGVASHAELANNCAACHPGSGSKATMESLCLACHVNVHEEIKGQTPLHGRLAEAGQCRHCHTEHRGPRAQLTDFSHFDHAATGFPLTEGHAGLVCARCHREREYQLARATCVSCHAEPEVHLGLFGDNCANCHTTSTWQGPGPQAIVAQLEGFDHDLTGFPLTGGHLQVGCAQCHTGESFAGISQTCAACHAEPQVHRGMFGTGCANCHSTTGWQELLPEARERGFVEFDHARTGFALSGAHGALACAACHTGEGFTGLESNCLACHAEPEVHAGMFGTNCGACHSTESWGQMLPGLVQGNFAGFDHAATGFALTGAHSSVTCADCHTGQGFAGLEATCIACHAEPEIHAGSFGTDCASCHATVTWDDARLLAESHSFPINHGGGRDRGACANCHQEPELFTGYTCYNCHEHTPERTARQHRRLTPERLSRCVDCHPRGHE